MFKYYEKFPILIQSLIILALAFFLHWFLRRSIRLVLSRLNDKGYQTTKINFIKNSLGFIIYGIALVLIILNIHLLRDLGKSLLAGAGIFAAIIGFASREAFADIINGVFLVIYKPFQIDDIIQLDDGLKGTVSDITFRHTVIEDFENRKIIIPNSKIGDSTIINSSLDDDLIRKQINFSISYESNEDLAKAIIREEIEKHPLCMDRRTLAEKKNNVHIVPVLMTEWQASAVNLRAYVWTASYKDSFLLQCDVLDVIKKRFASEGISIPYPQLQIHQ